MAKKVTRERLKEVTAIEFVRIWQTSADLDEVKRRIDELAGRDVSLGVIQARASSYRQRKPVGVNLKRMPGRNSRINVDELNAEIKRIALSDLNARK